MACYFASAQGPAVPRRYRTRLTRRRRDASTDSIRYTSRQIPGVLVRCCFQRLSASAPRTLTLRPVATISNHRFRDERGLRALDDRPEFPQERSEFPELAIRGFTRFGSSVCLIPSPRTTARLQTISEGTAIVKAHGRVTGVSATTFGRSSPGPRTRWRESNTRTKGDDDGHPSLR